MASSSQDLRPNRAIPGSGQRRWLTIQQVAGWLGVSRDTVERWVNTGQLRAIDVSAKPGRGRPSWRVSADNLEAFLKARANRQQALPVPTRRRRRPDVIEFIK